MTTNHTIDVEAERAAFITAYRLWCYDSHPDSHPEMVFSMAESHWGRAAGAMWLAAKRNSPAVNAGTIDTAGQQANQAHVMPPSAAPASQHGSLPAVLQAAKDALTLLSRNQVGRARLRSDEAIVRAGLGVIADYQTANVEQSSPAGSAKGGITKLDLTDYATPTSYSNSANFTAPEVSASPVPRAQGGNTNNDMEKK